MKSAMPIDVIYLSNSQVESALGISPSTLRRTTRLLRKKLGSEFDRKPYEPGFTPEAFQILQEYFTQTARNGGRTRR